MHPDKFVCNILVKATLFGLGGKQLTSRIVSKDRDPETKIFHDALSL